MFEGKKKAVVSRTSQQSEVESQCYVSWFKFRIKSKLKPLVFHMGPFQMGPLLVKKGTKPSLQSNY